MLRVVILLKDKRLTHGTEGEGSHGFLVDIHGGDSWTHGYDVVGLSLGPRSCPIPWPTHHHASWVVSRTEKTPHILYIIRSKQVVLAFARPEHTGLLSSRPSHMRPRVRDARAPILRVDERLLGRTMSEEIGLRQTMLYEDGHEGDEMSAAMAEAERRVASEGETVGDATHLHELQHGEGREIWRYGLGDGELRCKVVQDAALLIALGDCIELLLLLAFHYM